MNLRELNYILIPRAQESWERIERSPVTRVVWPLLDLVRSVTLEGQVVAVAMLVAAAAGVDVRGSSLYLVFCALFSLLFVALVMRPSTHVRPDAVSLRVCGLSRVLAGGVAVIELEVENLSNEPLDGLRIVGPFLPWDARWVGPLPGVSTLAPGEGRRVFARVELLLRGDRTLGRFEVARAGALGLVLGRSVRSEAARVLVLPRPHVEPGDALSERAEALEGGRGRLYTSASAFELLGVRPYRTGDRPRDIVMRAWARHGELIVRERGERDAEQRAVVLDLRGGGRRAEVEVAVALAAGALSAWSPGTGRLRLVLFGQHTMSLDIPDAAGLGRAMDALAALNAGPVAAQGDDARFELRTLSRAVRSVAIVALHDAPLAGPQAAAALGSRLAVAWLVARDSDRVAAMPGARVVDASRLARALGVPT